MSGAAPQVNGPTSPTGKYIDTIDPEDEEYQKNLRRPADVKEDMKQMEDRSRVSLILNSEAFRRELEDIIDEQIRQGNHPASLLALQQISNLLVPNAKFSQQGTLFRGTAPVIPISDIKGVDAAAFTKAEKSLRCKLAALYRLVDLNGWSQGIYNHISARINQEQEHFLINPFGLHYSEITASSLVKVDIRGETIDTGSTNLGINLAGFTLHSAIHQFRPDIKCIIHIHTNSSVAVSSMKCGLLPMSQEALICGEVSYHDYNGILTDPAEKETLQRNLGPNNKIMLLRNHGIVACGSSVEEAYHFAINVTKACDIQIQAMPIGIDNIVLVSKEIQQKTAKVGSQSGGGGGVDTSGKKWKCGELEFEAQMRLLDNAGYRTGYPYKQPVIKREVLREKSNSGVEIPPSSSSFTYVFDGDIEHSKYVSPIKLALERQKQQHKVGWLNSPNVYVKQEIEEIGTQNPKKITKWVAEEGASPKHTSTPIKVENPNQFAPQGKNPKEYKEKQKQIKKDYYEERVTAGPSSKVLEGISWEEAEKLKDGSLSATGDSVIVIGAASKGIIQRDQQHNVQVYKTQYAANPFENMSEEEIERYKYEIEHKGMPPEKEEEETLEPGPEGKLISTEERIQQVQQKAAESSPAKHVEISEDEPVVPPKPDRQPSDSGEVFQPPSPKSPATPTSRVQPEKAVNGEDEHMRSPAKSDTLRSTDSASGGETLEERSSREGSPTKEHPSPAKEKKKKKKFRMPSFTKTKKSKDSKESTI